MEMGKQYLLLLTGKDIGRLCHKMDAAENQELTIVDGRSLTRQLQRIAGEIGTCLKLIECAEETPTVLSGEMAARAFGAWQRARESIYQAWTFETDPANLQPQVRRLNREVAEFLRAHPHPEIDQQRLQRCLDAVEAPWSRREENELRAAWSREFATPEDKGRHLVEAVERIGAEPFEPPEPLPPIAHDDIQLICWLAIEGEEADRIEE